MDFERARFNMIEQQIRPWNVLDQDVLDSAWQNVTFTADPLPATLAESADHAVQVGLLDQAGIDAVGGFDGLYDLEPINAALTAAGLDALDAS